MNSAFTMIEITITLIIAAIITSISIPILSHNFSDTIAAQYKDLIGNSTSESYQGISQLQGILDEVISNSTMLVNGNLTNNSTTTTSNGYSIDYKYRFCNEFANKLNLMSTLNCSYSHIDNLNPSNNVPNFTTTNEMQWYGFDNDFVGGNLTIQVDVNGNSEGVNSNLESNPNQDILNITISNTGFIQAPPVNSNEYKYINGKS